MKGEVQFLMIINYKNKKTFSNLDVHDSIFHGYYYHYGKRQISFTCEHLFRQKVFTFKFDNVIYSSIQSCDFWHGGDTIYGVSTGDDAELMKTLYSLATPEPGIRGDAYLLNESSYVLFVFHLNSGDVLSIFAQELDIEETDTLIT